MARLPTRSLTPHGCDAASPRDRIFAEDKLYEPLGTAELIRRAEPAAVWESAPNYRKPHVASGPQPFTKSGPAPICLRHTAALSPPLSLFSSSRSPHTPMPPNKSPMRLRPYCAIGLCPPVIYGNTKAISDKLNMNIGSRFSAVPIAVIT